MISAVFILFCSLVKGLKDKKNRESQHYSSWRQLVDVKKSVLQFGGKLGII
jgi:hypothetical protein